MTDERKDWLERRRKAVGASDVAAILGVEGAFGTPMTVYNSKVLGVEAEQTDQMLMGLASEAGIAALYTKHTGRVVEDPGPYTLRKHHGAPLAATLDRFITGPDFRGPLQLKASAGPWGDDPPLAYVVQVQAEMACTGEAQAALAGWVGGRKLIHYEIPRDEEFQAMMLVAVIAFWTQHIERRIPPDPTAADARALQKLYPKDAGTTIALSDTALVIADERDQAKAEEAAAKERHDLASNRLKAALGEATFGVLPDGSRMKWSVREVKEHVRRASSSRVLTRLKAPKGKR